MNSNRDLATSSMDGAGTVLALDGGNSKTDAAVVTAGGALLARVRGPGFRPHLGREEALAGLHEVSASALQQAGLRRVSLLSACLANSDLPQEDAEYGEWFQAKGFADQVAVTNDVFALLRSGTRARAAVTVVCGAGMNCVGVAPGREPVRFLALGTFTGDWGGGGTLSDQAMFWAMRAEDGRSGPTALARAIPDHFGVSSTHQVAEALHLGTIDRHRSHELVPLLFRVAAAGDAAALSRGAPAGRRGRCLRDGRSSAVGTFGYGDRGGARRRRARRQRTGAAGTDFDRAGGAGTQSDG